MKRYYLLKDNATRGPYTFEDLVQLHRLGDITSFDKIGEEGGNWIDAFKVMGALSRADEKPRVSAAGSSAGAIAGIASFFVPGLGQLIQGRLLMGVFYFVFAIFLWFIFLGWLVHLASAYEAATYRAA